MANESIGNMRVTNLSGVIKKDVQNVRVTKVAGVGNGGLVKMSISKLMNVAKGRTRNIVVSNLTGVDKSCGHNTSVNNLLGVDKRNTSNVRFTKLTGVSNKGFGKFSKTNLLDMVNRSLGNVRVSTLAGVATKSVANIRISNLNGIINNATQKLRVNTTGVTVHTGKLRVNLFGCCGRGLSNFRLKLIGTGPRAGIRLVFFNNGTAGLGMNTHFGGQLFCAVLNNNARCLSFNSGFSTTLFCHTNLRLPLCGRLFVDKSLKCRRVRAFGGGSCNVPTHLCTLRTHIGLRCRLARHFNVFLANNCNNDHCCARKGACSGNVVMRNKIAVLGLWVVISPWSTPSCAPPTISSGPRSTWQIRFLCPCPSPSCTTG